MPSPYTLKEFIKIVSNYTPVADPEDTEKVLASHQDLFRYLNNIPYTFYFIHDFVKFRYIMFSTSVKKILGVDCEVLLQGGFGKALEYFHEEDRNNIRLIHAELFGYFYEQPIEERCKLRFDFNFRLVNTRGEVHQILQQSIFTSLLDGKPLYDFSTCTDISRQKRNNRMELTIYRLDKEEIFVPVFYYVVPSTIEFGLSKAEFNVLRYVSQGLASKQIADLCCRSEHTINNHKKKILSKTKSKSLAEAIAKVDL